LININFTGYTHTVTNINGLQTFRKEKKLTVRDISLQLEISESYYYKIESGIRKPTYEFIRKFKEVFKVNVDEIFFWSCDYEDQHLS